MRTPQFMEHLPRSSKKPECISAAALRAHARAAASTGQTWACRSAKYSTIESESHTSNSPSFRQGTLPDGDTSAMESCPGASPKGMRVSVNGMESSRFSTQGRKDHEE